MSKRGLVLLSRVQAEAIFRYRYELPRSRVEAMLDVF